MMLRSRKYLLFLAFVISVSGIFLFQHQKTELEQYLSDFPLSQYQVYVVPGQGSFYVDQVDDYIKAHLCRGEIWEPHIIALLDKFIIPRSTVVDIGAHIGTQVISMAQLTGPSGKVLAFEPQRKIFRELYWNCRLNSVASNVEVHRVAIGETNKMVEMNPSAYRNEGGTSIGSGGDPVEVRTLDSFHLSNVSLIKIDVETYEDNVLAGAAKTIRENQPAIIIELMGGWDRNTAPPAIKDKINRSTILLNMMGYEVQYIAGADYLALPRNKEYSN